METNILLEGSNRRKQKKKMQNLFEQAKDLMNIKLIEIIHS